jgi:hypothetical protein
MKKVEFDSGLDSQKKVMVSLFWTNRKAARTEGCAPFLIKKIITTNNIHTPEGTKLLKIADEIMDDMAQTLDAGETVDMEVIIGEESINASLSADAFSVSVVKSPEIEDEIVEKLKMEMQKKFPSLCDSFAPRVTPQN